jgi:protein-S-isoprenylcysteine O-methyltransferase Ste14
MEGTMDFGPWIILFSVLVYGFVHSLLATSAAKARARQWFGPGADRWYRLAYNTFGILTFLPVLALVAELSSERLYIIPAPWSYVALAGQLLALLALVIGFLQTGIWSFLGFEQMLNPSPNPTSQMVTDGLYRWVRHPLYTAGLAFIWLTPIMTSNLLALNIGLTLYLILGAIYEERKLVREFGERYTRYQERVPMLIPRLIKIPPTEITDE